jgi:hypothetical protein
LAQSRLHDLETQDNHGTTAYILALKLGHTRAAMMLLEAGACPRAKTPMGWEAHQIAALTGNPNLIRMSVVAMLKDLDLGWERRLPKHLDRLSKMPDFTMVMEWKFSSWVPFVTGLLPQDTVTISKRGTAVRIDSTLLGFSGLSWGRGSISFLVQGTEQGNPGAWFVMDNELKTAANARAALTNPPDHTIADWLRKLLGSAQKRPKWNGAGISVEEEVVTSWMGFGESAAKLEDVGGFKGCLCHKLLGLTMVEWQHTPVLKAGFAKEDWWVPAYSATARRMVPGDRHPGVLSEKAAGGTWPEDDGASGPVAAGADADAIAASSYGAKGAPDKGIKSLHTMLELIKQGDVASASAAATSTALSAESGGDTAAESGAGGEASAEAEATSAPAAAAVTVEEGIVQAVLDAGWAKAMSFDDYFRGCSHGVVSSEVAELQRRGEEGSIRLDSLCGGVRIVAPTESRRPKEEGAEGDYRFVADMFPEHMTRDEKEFKGRVLLAPDFPIDGKDMLPLAEVMVSPAPYRSGFVANPSCCTCCRRHRRDLWLDRLVRVSRRSHCLPSTSNR